MSVTFIHRNTITTGINTADSSPVLRRACHRSSRRNIRTGFLDLRLLRHQASCRDRFLLRDMLVCA